MDTLKGNDDARGRGCDPNVGDDPMCVVLRRPAVEKETAGDKERAWDHEGDAEFGAPGMVVSVL